MNPELAASLDAMTSRIIAIEVLLYALADTCPDRRALWEAFDLHAAEIQAGMAAIAVPEHQLDRLRNSLGNVRGAIRMVAESRDRH